ncbi:MAG: hypothetical protein K2I52_01190 [Muribaculaceae bacterium]|nr:hypothetical protein [Muribaculaceae bacterium]
MAKNVLFVLLFSVIASINAIADDFGREINMPTEHLGKSVNSDYMQFDEGFFASAELSGGYSLNSNRTNLGFSELSAVGGYRISEYFRTGIGFGARVYVGSSSVRNMNHRWGLPLFLNMRGNFIPGEYRDVVPFWSMDIGSTFPDGFFVRPTLGVRVGQKRSSFVVSIGYMGQHLRVYKENEPFYSFITLKIGYEF